MVRRATCILNFLILFSAGAVSQGNSTYWGLTQFLNSQFMTNFDEARSRAEQSVIDFQNIRHEFSEDDVAAVMDAYNASAERFNQILYKVQEDLLDRKKRKFIIKFPDDYSSEIEGELNRAKEFYSNNYQREVIRVTDGRITGTPLLALLPEIIKYGKMAFELFKTIKKEIKKYNTAMMEEHLIQPYRFRSWNELAAR